MISIFCHNTFASVPSVVLRFLLALLALLYVSSSPLEILLCSVSLVTSILRGICNVVFINVLSSGTGAVVGPAVVVGGAVVVVKGVVTTLDVAMTTVLILGDIAVLDV